MVLQQRQTPDERLLYLHAWTRPNRSYGVIDFVVACAQFDQGRYKAMVLWSMCKD
jgi:hypothetical protein